MPSPLPRPLCLTPVSVDGERPGGATAPASWATVLDPGALARLAELDPKGRAGLVARVVKTFTQSLNRLLDELERARLAGDREALRHVAHTLKSSSASVGALRLSSLCADIERRVKNRQGEGLDAQLDALALEGRRLLAGLDPSRAPATLNP